VPTQESEIITRAVLDGIVSFEGEVDDERSQELARFHDAVENALQEIVRCDAFIPFSPIIRATDFTF
jgi:hypothetical protein